MRYKANRSLKCHKKTEHNIVVADYQVGIWRKGPIPPVPENGRKAVGKRKAKPNNAVKDVNVSKNLLVSFRLIGRSEIIVHQSNSVGCLEVKDSNNTYNNMVYMAIAVENTIKTKRK